ncbi:tubulin monoglycylase TTLL3 [Nyctibius grandis]|uniref:tubulin monoglycylase TTLL3 n=1 Tax=Nyctibius grandis TaxID=48427 RepID=UPI0035BC824F
MWHWGSGVCPSHFRVVEPVWRLGPGLCHHNGAGVGGLHPVPDPPTSVPSRARGQGTRLVPGGGRASPSSPRSQAAVGQCHRESSTVGTQIPSQGQRVAGGAAAGAGGEQVVSRRTQGTGMRLDQSVHPVSGTPGLVRQRQAGQAAPATAGHHSRHRRSGHRPLLDREQLRRARLHVERAIKEKKIFVVQGPYPVMRSLLRARGWVEKKLPRAGRQPVQRHDSLEMQLWEEEEEEEGGEGAEQGEAVLDTQPGSACCGAQPSLGTPEHPRSPWPPEEEEEEEKEEEQRDEDPDGIHNFMSHLVQDQVPYFIWTNHLGAIDCQMLRQDQVVNHYAQAGAFATKEGLCLNLRNLPWVHQADPDTFFPRCYRLGAVDERQAFIEDFRLTAARSLLKVALERAGDTPAGTEQPLKSGKGPAHPRAPKATRPTGNHVPHPMPSTVGPGPLLPPQLVEQALQVCGQHLGSLGHEDIDGDPPFPRMTGTDWDRFLRDYYRVVHEGAGLALSGAQQERCRALLRGLAGRLPQLAVEGDRNVWILKPGAKSRGRGIVCTTQLEEVLQLAQRCMAPSVRPGEWVVQKYVERLLLVFGTKFDIRQWILVTNWNPLTVWFYRDSYLRFCSQPFSLRHLDPARHLCNVSIQKRYPLAQGWHPRLPLDRIWSCRQLQAYLAQVGRAEAWHQVMVPGMKAAVLGALRSAQDLVVSRKSSFELYGADFVFGEDCQPWLLEINVSPTMAPSSAVTSRLCASVQRDVLRVVIDRRDDPTCPTGAFELIYKEAVVPTPLYTGLKLMVEGRSLRKRRPAQHHSHRQLPPPPPSTPQPPAPPGPWGRATKVPQLGAPRGRLAPLGRRSCRGPAASTPRAPPHPPGTTAPPGVLGRGLLQLGRLHGQPQAALPQLRVHPPARISTLPPRGAPAGSPWGPMGRSPSFPPVEALRLPALAPSARTLRPCPGQPGPAAGSRHAVAPRGTQKSCDTEGHPGRASTLPVPAGATRWHPAPPHPSWTPFPGGGTQPTPLRGCKTRL